MQSMVCFGCKCECVEGSGGGWEATEEGSERKGRPPKLPKWKEQLQLHFNSRKHLHHRLISSTKDIFEPSIVLMMPRRSKSSVVLLSMRHPKHTMRHTIAIPGPQLSYHCQRRWSMHLYEERTDEAIREHPELNLGCS